MPNLSVELSDETYERLQHRAASCGQTPSEFVNDLVQNNTIQDTPEMLQLLHERLEAAKNGPLLEVSADDIKRMGRQELAKRKGQRAS